MAGNPLVGEVSASEAALRRFIDAAVAQDMTVVPGLSILPVLLGMPGLGLPAPDSYVGLKAARLEDLEDGSHVYDAVVHGATDQRLRLTMSEWGGVWKVIGALLVDEEGNLSEPPSAFPPLTLDWLGVETEWGIRAEPGPPEEGLTLRRINVGPYAEMPDHWSDPTMRARGSAAVPGVESMGYSIYDKAEVWADSCVDLYEEAIQQRWKAATDIDWEAIELHGGELELALRQLCTELSERAYWKGVVIGRWLREIAAGFMEVKAYLATDIFAAARHAEAFRKRARLGGGLGMQPRTHFYRTLWDAQSWSELSLLLHVVADTFTDTLYRWGAERIASGEPERQLFELARRDSERSLTYGRDHLQFLLSKEPERASELHTLLRKAEAAFVLDLKDSSLLGALSVLLGGGVDELKAGYHETERLLGEFVERYVGTLRGAGIERGVLLHPDLAKYR